MVNVVKLIQGVVSHKYNFSKNTGNETIKEESYTKNSNARMLIRSGHEMFIMEKDNYFLLHQSSLEIFDHSLPAI